MSQAMHRDQTAVAAASIALEPLLMSVGDLIHPQEPMDPAVQAAVIGRYVSEVAGFSAATMLLDTFQAGIILGIVMVGGIAFFVGVALMAVPLILAGGPLRPPALAFIVGELLIAAEIVTAQVLLSQIGNLAFLGGGVLFGQQILLGRQASHSL